DLRTYKDDEDTTPCSRGRLTNTGEIVFVSHFFFSSRRRHTRWPRDWSSDVCSSDLFDCSSASTTNRAHKDFSTNNPERALNHGRSEERRVGKECRSRWSPDH